MKSLRGCGNCPPIPDKRLRPNVPSGEQQAGFPRDRVGVSAGGSGAHLGSSTHTASPFHSSGSNYTVRSLGFEAWGLSLPSSGWHRPHTPTLIFQMSSPKTP